MWLFTCYGFFSVVNTPAESDVIVIRSRNRDHLEKLIDGFNDYAGPVDGYDEQTGFAAAISKDKIISYNDPDHKDMYLRDYEHRVYVDVEQWVEISAWLAADVTYDNFKTKVSQGNLDRDYMAKLIEVYITMEDKDRDYSRYDEHITATD